MSTGRPRVIRKVIAYGRDKRPKKAKDRKTGIRMERVKARAPRSCRNHACPHGGTIGGGAEYARINWPTWSKHASRAWILVNNRAVPLDFDYHFGCVPEEAQPLVRFFEPLQQPR